jgi:hypothetical protein
VEVIGRPYCHVTTSSADYVSHASLVRPQSSEGRGRDIPLLQEDAELSHDPHRVGIRHGVRVPFDALLVEAAITVMVLGDSVGRTR